MAELRGFFVEQPLLPGMLIVAGMADGRRFALKLPEVAAVIGVIGNHSARDGLLVFAERVKRIARRQAATDRLP